jgi:translation initiation factor eIF-2B subunit gamma
MVTQSALDGQIESDVRGQANARTVGFGGGNGNRGGGLGVWYQTRGREESVKGEVTDLVAITPLEEDETPLVRHPVNSHCSLRSNLSKLVSAMPMDTLKTKMDEDKGFLVRHSLLTRHGRVKMLTTYRDAHIYIFPYWVKLMAKHNEKFESVSEDLIGWWAKSEWQNGLGEKLGLREILQPRPDTSNQVENRDDYSLEDEIDLQAMSTTRTGIFNYINGACFQLRESGNQYATRVNTASEHSSDASDKKPLAIPSILAYIHSSQPSAPLIRRVDSSTLLLSVSLRLAKLESIEEAGRATASPLAHSQKVAHPTGIAQRSTITKNDCLLAENVTVEEKCVIKECVIGANCHIASGARLTRCVLMDGVVIGERCQLTGCIIGRRSQIGRESVLKECEVQDGNVVPEDTDAKNEKFMVFEGLDESGEMNESANFDEANDGDTAF